MNASRRFYQLLDQGRAHLQVLDEVQGWQQDMDADDAQRQRDAMQGLFNTFAELYRLLPEVKHDVRERIMKRATAMYCHALKVPYSEDMRRQLAQESVVAHNLDGSQYVDGVSPVCVVVDEKPDHENGCPVCGGPDWPNCHGRVVES